MGLQDFVVNTMKKKLTSLPWDNTYKENLREVRSWELSKTLVQLQDRGAERGVKHCLGSPEQPLDHDAVNSWCITF